MRHITRILSTGICCLALFVGCSTPNKQLATCQAEKEQLLTALRGQRDTTRALYEQVASLETRLDQSEKELARAGTGTRISSRPSEPKTAAPQPTKSDSLPWRSPASKAEPSNSPSDAPASDASSRDKRGASGTTGASSASLLALARRDRRVQYDAAAHAARVELPIAFDDKTATLTANDKRQLDELAKLLKSDDARELRVMVAGFAAGRPSASSAKSTGDDRFSSARQLGTVRAQAVADYLDRHGIAQERLAVSGTSASAASVAAASGVEVYLLESDAPMVGWGAGQSIRR